MPLTPTPSDLHLLISYPWPGNVRELQSVIERAVILGNGQRLDVATALLGINPHTLRARMLKLKIDWKRFRDVKS